MSKQVTISLDVMGGDHGPDVVVPAALEMLARISQLHLILVGDEKTLQQRVSGATPEILSRLEIKHASQIVEMHEPAAQALRGKKDSSMRVAINLVKEGRA
ncbi:MAG: phosphate acyltransferase, partial [Gammaproteobacteria bacterium]